MYDNEFDNKQRKAIKAVLKIWTEVNLENYLLIVQKQLHFINLE